MKEDYFANRASVRTFTGEAVSEKLIDSVIERAMRAPTCGNMQLYSVIVTRDKEMKEKVDALHFNQPASTGSDVILTICADFNRMNKWCEASGAPTGCYNNFHSFIMALTDAVIFAQQIVTIAETEGLGTCYLGTVNYTAEELSKLLELPEMVVPVAAIALGWPAENQLPLTDRLPLDAIRHKERYKDESPSQIREKYYKFKEGLKENLDFVKENGKDSLAAIFTDIRYPESVNKSVSESFMRLIKEKGYEKL